MSTHHLDEQEKRLRSLWLHAQNGDETAYREALQMCVARLRSYFGRRLQHQPQDTEDLVQETLLALHLHRGTYDNAVPVTVWVHAIARHKLIDHLRRQGVRQSLFESMEELPEDWAPQVTCDLTAGRDLNVLLQVLPEAQRRAILLTKIEGLSVAEAAHRGGVSQAAVKVQVHRGLKQLAALIRKRP